MSSPIFGTGLARSGGGLYSMCLSTHPELMVACCPNIELFRSYRNAMIRHMSDPSFLAACLPHHPLQDWYGTNERIAILDYLLEKSDLNIPFDPAEWPSFLDISIRRGDLETADLARNYSDLRGATYKDIFDNLLSIISKTRGCESRKWVGLHETWVLDYFPLLARAYPDARFLIMFRDPRATVNSMLGIKNIDPSQVAQVLSYVRHWRKNVALALKYSSDPQFRDRLHISAHELILTQPDITLTNICNALDLDLDKRMLDTNNFLNYATGETWSGNSSFEASTQGFKSDRAFRWKSKLDPIISSFIEFLCGSELKRVGYPTFTEFADPSSALTNDVLDFFLQDHSFDANWRSDLKDPAFDLGIELVRRNLLSLESPCTSNELVRRNFLFQETYDDLRQATSNLLPSLLQSVS